MTGPEQADEGREESRAMDAQPQDVRDEGLADTSEGDVDASEDASGEQAPGRKRRRRRRKRSGNRAESTSEAPAASASPAPRVAPERASAPRVSDPARAKTLSTLTAGLFSHLDDRPVPCKVEGCSNTWLWSAEEQIQAFGQPPPKRMCAEHVARAHEVADREVPCARPGCSRTWKWPKSAQLAQVQKGGSLEPPSRICDACRKEERDLADQEVPCRLEGCTRTWTWPKDAQLRHRAWLRRQGEEAPEEHEGKGRNRKRRRRKASAEGPPKRLCQVCHDKLSQLSERETTCKVHGCTRTVAVDKESQLRMWIAQGGEQPDAQAPLPKRMCEVCREFCRLHGDREVACARPECTNTWTFKTGAQLQASLAGRFDDPLRLCETCAQSGDVPGFALRDELSPETERMPCIVPGCEGSWQYDSSTALSPAREGDLPLDRMCASCRSQRHEDTNAVPGDAAGDPTTVSADDG